MAPHSIELPADHHVARGVVRPRKFRRRVRRHGHSDNPPYLAINREVLIEAAGRGGGAGWIATSRIPRRDDQGLAPLSLAQEGLWLFQQLFPDNAVLNTFRTLRPARPFDQEILELALTEVVRRHDILRTNFRIVDGTPMQIVRPPEPVSVGVLDLTGLPPSERKAELVHWLGERTAEPFDLAEGALFRADLIWLSDDDQVVLFNLHHIICDGWSLGVLTRETNAFYDAIRRGRECRLPEPPLQYGDYAAWQRTQLQAEAIERQLSYWRTRLAHAPEAIELPCDRPRPQDRAFRGAQRAVALDSRLVVRLRLLCQRERCTLFMVLVGALATLFHRCSGATDLVIGSPVANRGMREIEPLIGLFMNTVALRFDLAGDPSFRQFLERVRGEALEAFANQDVPFDKVVDALGIRREKTHAPLFQVMFVMQPPRAASVYAELGVESAALTPRGSKFDFTLALCEGEDGEVNGHIEYDTDLFERATIDRLFEHYVALLEGIAADPLQRISALPVLDAEAHRREVVGWNATAANYPEVCLHQLVAAQAARTPEAVALRFGEQRIAYRELEQRANRLAWHLHGLGVGPDTVVGLCLQRSPEQVIALLAILKAGGAYLPLDPNYPAGRLAYMIADARPQVIVTDAALLGSLPAQSAPVVQVDMARGAIAAQPPTSPPVATHPDDLAYVLYTSGSTGQPKGVMGTHRAIVNRLHWDPAQADAEETYAYKTTPGFIDSLWEIFMPLIRGQSTVIVPEDVACDPARFVDLLAREGATRLVLVPSFLRGFLNSTRDLAKCLPRLGHWACSGEALPSALAAAVRARLPSAELFNVYGASEFWDAAAGAATGRASGSSVPIGTPIANMRALVLDDNLEPVPVNVVGELYIGGAGLARGYLGRPGLTAERFVPDPFGDGERLYRTGDMARRGPDGAITFIGRRDHQVKLNGHRIELAEVELALQQYPGVRQAAVLLRDDLPAGEPALVAYVVAADPAPDDCTLRKHLQASLPSYMVPAHFIALAQFPLTPSGKIDRAALSPPQPKQGSFRIGIAPKSEPEKMLAAIWGEVLGVEDFGIDDNFFELGGGSLMLVRVQGRISDRLGREIPLIVLFRYPTIRALSSYLMDGQRDDILLASTRRGEARKRFLMQRTRLQVRPRQ